MFELESHSKHPLILSASCKKLETWQLPVSRADVNIYIMYMRGTSHVSGSPVLLFFLLVVFVTRIALDMRF